MKKSEKDRPKRVVCESTLSTAGAVPLPQWGRQRGGGFAAKKKANPASLRSAAPSKGRGSRGYSLLPMEGGAPKGRRLDGDAAIPDTKPSPMGKAAIRGYRFSRHNAFPNGEGKEEAASPLKKEANPASLRSAAPSKGRGSRAHSLLPMEGGAPKGRRLDGKSVIPDTKPSPQGEGGERSEPDRVLVV